MAGSKTRIGDWVFAALPFVPLAAIGLLAGSEWVQKGLESWVTRAELVSLGSLALLWTFFIWRGRHLHEDEWVWAAVPLSLAGVGWLGWYAWCHYLAALPSLRPKATLSTAEAAHLTAHLAAMTSLIGLAGNVALGLGALLGIWFSNKKDRRLSKEAGKLSLTLLKADMNKAITLLEGSKSTKPNVNDVIFFQELGLEISRRIADGKGGVPDDIDDKLSMMKRYFATIDRDDWDGSRLTQATASVEAIKALIKYWSRAS